MNLSSKTAALAAVLALSAAPAFAIPANPGTARMPDNAGTAHIPTTTTPAETTPVTPGPGASAGAKGKAYGKYCASYSKKHVAGEKGTPFSRCVTAMAKVAKSDASPATACKTESKKHVKGEKGTAFSTCVSAAAKLKADLAKVAG